MKKIRVIVFLAMAGVGSALGLTACGANFGSGPGPSYEYVSTEMTKLPEKLDYIEGEVFNPSGLEITEKYSHKHNQNRYDKYRWEEESGIFSFSHTGELTEEITSITVTIGMHPAEFIIPITVRRIVSGDFTARAWGRIWGDWNTEIKLVIWDYSGNGGNVTIPAQIEGMPVAVIGDGAFYNNQLTSITIPDSVTYIAGNAFAYNQLTGVTIPNSVTGIGSTAFYDNLLTSVSIGNSVTDIGAGAFGGNQGLTAIHVSPNNQYYKSVDGVVYNKNGTSLIQWPTGKAGPVTIPDGVTGIGESAFSGCSSLVSVTIGNSVTRIEKGAFSGCQLTDITIPNGVTYIGVNAFNGNKLTSVIFPASLHIIDINAFYNNPLISITFASICMTNYAFPEFRDELFQAGTLTRPDTNSTVWTKQ